MFLKAPFAGSNKILPFLSYSIEPFSSLDATRCTVRGALQAFSPPACPVDGLFHRSFFQRPFPRRSIRPEFAALPPSLRGFPGRRTTLLAPHLVMISPFLKVPRFSTSFKTFFCQYDPELLPPLGMFWIFLTVRPMPNPADENPPPENFGVINWFHRLRLSAQPKKILILEPYPLHQAALSPS